MRSRSSKHIILTLLLLGFCVSFAAGQTSRTSSSPVTITEAVSDDLLTAARELHVQAEVKGDLADAGERITIDGPIELLASVMVAYRIGSWLFERMNRPQASPWARMALGVFVVSLAISIPFAGPLFAIAVLIAGTGALVLERRELFKAPALAS